MPKAVQPPIRAVRYFDRKLPNGLLDAIRQFALFYAAYFLYSLVRGGSDGNEQVALLNGQHVFQLEHNVGLWFEPQVQSFALDHRWLADFANFMYLNSHFIGTILFLFWLYLFRNPSFYFVRNLMMAAMVIALVGYAFLPTMPPRFVPGLGIEDTLSTIGGTLSTIGGVHRDDAAIKALINPYAAIPSMHSCFALIVGFTCFRLVKWRWIARAWLLYPALVVWVVIATGNHFWLDAVLGGMTAALAFAAARVMAGWRQESWAFRPAQEEATA